MMLHSRIHRKDADTHMTRPSAQTLPQYAWRPHPESAAEEAASGITHAIGAVLAAVALAVLVTLASLHGDTIRIVSLSIYGACLVLLYLASTCFHICRRERLKHWFKVGDHVAIYTLIAGTYTPILLVLIRGAWGWSLLGAVWGLALIGTALKLFFVHRYEKLSVTIYVLMGWMGLIAIKPVLETVPGGALVWIFGGGIVYTIGVIFFFWDHLPFNHAIWHVFVLLGSACHFMAILLYVLPMS
jgi:hemolysin III